MRGELAVRRPARDPAVGALALNEPSLRVEGRAVAVAGILAQQFGRAARLDAVEFRLPHIDEIPEPVRVIDRAFGKREAGREALDVAVDQIVETGHGFLRLFFATRLSPGSGQ